MLGFIRMHPPDENKIDLTGATNTDQLVLIRTNDEFISIFDPSKMAGFWNLTTYIGVVSL